MQQKKISRRKEKAVLTKNKIYSSAEYLFSKYGFDAVNVDDIVKHAGVAKGSFYVHFESKDALIGTMISNYVNQSDMNYKTYLENLPSDMPESDRLIFIIEKIADVLTDKIGHENMKILYRTQLGKNDHVGPAMDYNRELYKMFEDIIISGIEKKIFLPELEADETARQLVMTYRGVVYEWIIRYPEFDLKAQASKLFNLLLAGMST